MGARSSIGKIGFHVLESASGIRGLRESAIAAASIAELLRDD
jgi:hypothetical protein